MSHVCTVDIDITDLDALDAACKRVGLEFVRNQKTYHWWGKHVGDYPIPEGFTEEDLGKCEHAIRDPNSTSKTRGSGHEIGVVRRRDGRPGYTLIWDFMDRGLCNRVGGTTADKLRQAYATEVARKFARRKGYRVREHTQPNGAVRLTLEK